MSSVVVIGAGLAGATTAQTLREHGYTGAVTLVGNEGLPPYERPGLSKKYLQGEEDAESLYVHPRGWYDQHSILPRLDDAAVSIDARERVVTLASGIQLGYVHLVLATGARARQVDLPGRELANVLTLRTLRDSIALRTSLRPQHNVVVVGGGWIGLEVAAAARIAGCDVVVLERQPQPLLAALGETVASFFADLHRRHGVDLRTNVTVVGIEGSRGMVTGVRTPTETIPADLVLIAAGAVPNTELARAAGLQVDHGIVVDERLRSSEPSILAAGDVAQAWHPKLQTHLLVEHWDNAIRQGRLAASSILNHPASHDWQPYFFTDQFDVGMEYVGHGSAQDEVVVRGDLASAEFIAFWLGGGRVKAAMNVNVWDVVEDLRALIGASLTSEQLADPSKPLPMLAA